VIPAMPRPHLPYLIHERTRHGALIWYVRKPDQKKVRIREIYGTQAFMDAYQAAMVGEAPQRPPGEAAGTLAWLVARYRDSGEWAGLATATRRQRENIFRNAIAKSGSVKVAAITQAVIVKARDKRKDTPAAARNFLDAMRGLFRWAKEAGLAKADPTEGVRSPKRRKGSGFPVWTDEDVAAYERRWPVGTKERVWLDVLLYTGLRRGDAVRLGRQHVSGGVATIKTEKSGYTVEVCIPILPVLAATLAAGPCGDLAFICGAGGGPLTKETFGNEFRDACRAAGVRKSAHGIRKIAATRCADNGATVAELESLFGWSGGGMASLYTRSADRRRLSMGAIEKIQKNGNATPIVQPLRKVGLPTP